MTPLLRLPLLIIIHDVAAPFRQELQVITECVRDLVGSRFSCAVVPRWHGKLLDNADGIPDLIAGCEELLLHGWTHFRDHKPGLISKLTQRSDEFGGLSARDIQQRIDLAIEELSSVTGRPVNGLLPPSWQLPIPATALNGLSYVVRFGRLESCHREAEFRRLATWSFDWGWLKQAAWAGDVIGSARFELCSNTIPCIAIHPIDVSRGWLPRISRLIRDLLERGYQPSIPQAVFAESAGTPQATQESGTTLKS